MFQQLHAVAQTLREAALDVADLAKDYAVGKLADAGGGQAFVPPKVFLTGAGRMTETATLMVYPPPDEIRNHLRLVRYAVEPLFVRGKNRAAAARRIAALLQSQPYLSTEHVGEMEVRMKKYYGDVSRETPSSIRQRVARILRRP